MSKGRGQANRLRRVCWIGALALGGILGLGLMMVFGWCAFVWLRVFLMDMGPPPEATELLEVAPSSGHEVALYCNEGYDLAEMYLRADGIIEQPTFYPVRCGFHEYEGTYIVYEFRASTAGDEVWLAERGDVEVRTVAFLNLETGVFSHADFGKMEPALSPDTIWYGTLGRTGPPMEVPGPDDGELLGSFRYRPRK